jgi:hypothetical protein
MSHTEPNTPNMQTNHFTEEPKTGLFTVHNSFGGWWVLSDSEYLDFSTRHIEIENQNSLESGFYILHDSAQKFWKLSTDEYYTFLDQYPNNYLQENPISEHQSEESDTSISTDEIPEQAFTPLPEALLQTSTPSLDQNPSTNPNLAAEDLETRLNHAIQRAQQAETRLEALLRKIEALEKQSLSGAKITTELGAETTEENVTNKTTPRKAVSSGKKAGASPI